MYVIYFLNSNYVITTKEVETLNDPILLTENCIVTNIRKGINFIKEPHTCLQLTHLERLIIGTEIFDTEFIKEGDFRRANTYITSNCQIDLPALDPSIFAFQPYYFKEEGCVKLGFNTCNYDDLKVLFSPDGITFDHTFDFAYWSSPEGLAQLGAASIFNTGNNDPKVTTVSLYLDPNFLTDTGDNASMPKLPFFYFENKSTGKKSETFDLSSFYPAPFSVVKTYGQIWNMAQDGNYVAFDINRPNAVLRYSLPDGTIVGYLNNTGFPNGSIYEYNTKDIPYAATKIDFLYGNEVFSYSV